MAKEMPDASTPGEIWKRNQLKECFRRCLQHMPLNAGSQGVFWLTPVHHQDSQTSQIEKTQDESPESPRTIWLRWRNGNALTRQGKVLSSILSRSYHKKPASSYELLDWSTSITRLDRMIEANSIYVASVYSQQHLGVNMNRLNTDKQEAIMRLLVEGNSIRSIERLTGVHRDTIIRLMKRVAANCESILDKKMRGLTMSKVQTDEIWTYVFKHKRFLKPEEQHGEYGDQFIYVAIDAETKLIPCYVVGKRNSQNTLRMMIELRCRVKNRRFQLTTDSYQAYAGAVDRVFGRDIDYGQLVKVYGNGSDDQREGYSPSEFVGVYPTVITGNPDQDDISTSYVERQNLTIRMSMRRLTRLTNGFSKKLECLKAALAIHFWHYNFMRNHASLRMTPAMAAGIESTFSNWIEVLA